MQTIFRDNALQKIFEEKGYVHIPFLSEEELEKVRAFIFGIHFKNDNHPTQTYMASLYDPEKERKLRLFKFVNDNLWPKVEEYLVDYEPLFTNVWQKKPGSGELMVHQNWTHVEESQYTSMSIWIPMEDASRENGTMEVIEGSHQVVNPIRGTGIPQVTEEISKVLIDKYLLPINANGGDAVFIDDSIIHRTGPNTTQNLRTALQILVKPKKARAVYYYLHPEKERENVEVFEVSKDLFLDFNFHLDTLRKYGETIGYYTFQPELISVEELQDRIQNRQDRNALFPLIPDPKAELLSYHSRMNALLERAVEFLEANQKENGEFPSLEYYPDVMPEKGWHYTVPSPFVHASILCALAEVKHDKLKAVKENGCRFLLSRMEGKGFWRFWQHGTYIRNVPIDLDDTALSSFVLYKYGFRAPGNKKAILAHRDENGYLLTWLLPTSKILFTQPGFYLKWRSDWKQCKETIEQGFLHPGEKEPSVAANGLLWLGENAATAACIRGIIEEVSAGEDFPLQYYEDTICTYYHIARAYHNGVRSFAKLKEVITARLAEKQDEQGSWGDPLKSAMAISTLLYFGDSNSTLYKGLLTLVKAMEQEKDFQPYPYFTSTDRYFKAGSPELTAAVVCEALSAFAKASNLQDHPAEEVGDMIPK